MFTISVLFFVKYNNLFHIKLLIFRNTTAGV